MSAHVEIEQAARLHRAEDRWLDQAADRLRRAASPRRPARTPVELAETTTPSSTETIR